jgi:microcystin-dependent protein
MDPFVAEIRIFPYSFAPTGWALCNGQLMAISQNTALFSLLGTFYGGDGRSTFALPNLMGSVPVQQGQGPGLQQWYLGDVTGSASVTLLQGEMPMHNHGLVASSSRATTTTASGNQIATGFKGSLASSSAGKMYSTAAPNVQLSLQSLTPSGGNQPHNNMMPYLAFNYCIALQGIFPQRS